MIFVKVFFLVKESQNSKDREMHCFNNIFKHANPKNIIKKWVEILLGIVFITIIWKEFRKKLKLASQSTLLFPSL